MRVTEADREAARLEAEQKATQRKPMPYAAKAALGRGTCKDCDMPWDCVATGHHVAVGNDWVCSWCFSKPSIRRKYFPDPEPVQVKTCALRSRCCRAVNRRGAVVTGGGPYCSAACRARAKFAENKMLARELAPETRINIG